jgi:DNA helicase II / ATP-dependent DNA helicase PcrA
MSDISPIDAILTKLNPQQRQAASHGDGPLLIVAGAGTGKTATLVHRVAWLIAGGVDPARILLLTFTRRAAAEMLSRVDSILRLLDKSKQTGDDAEASLNRDDKARSGCSSVVIV